MPIGDSVGTGARQVEGLSGARVHLRPGGFGVVLPNQLVSRGGRDMRGSVVIDGVFRV